MKNYEFRWVPSEKAVYRIQENCCYRKVIYEGPGMGVIDRIDRDNEVTGVLLCYCYPSKEITPVTEDFYLTYYTKVTGQPLQA